MRSDDWRQHTNVWFYKYYIFVDIPYSTVLHGTNSSDLVSDIKKCDASDTGTGTRPQQFL